MELLEFSQVWMYYLVLYIPVGLLFVTFMVLHVTIVTIISIRKSWNKPIPAVWRAIIDITLTGGLKTKTEDGKIQYFLFDYPVTPRYVRSIGLFVIALWQSLLITFWLSFIIKVTDGCNNGACFFGDGSKIKGDCLIKSIFASQSSNSSITITCYEFQFDFINGAGTAGGLLTIGITILYGQMSAQIWLRKKISKSIRKYKKRWLKLLSYLLGVVPLIVTTLLIIFGVITLYNRSNPFTALLSYINAVFYLVPLQVISTYPLCTKTRLFTDPEADSPGPDAYTLMEDGQVPINDNYTKEQPMRKRAHTIL